MSEYNNSILEPKKEINDLEEDSATAELEEDDDDNYDDDEESPLIVIVGDDPGLSTGAVGYITFDGQREILVPYQDYPQAYKTPTGKHHVLITADPKSSPMYSMTAKLDKDIDFGYNNVLWVDIRSTYSNTQIDWKLLPRSEHERIPAEAKALIIERGSIN